MLNYLCEHIILTFDTSIYLIFNTHCVKYYAKCFHIVRFMVIIFSRPKVGKIESNKKHFLNKDCPGIKDVIIMVYCFLILCCV